VEAIDPQCGVVEPPLAGGRRRWRLELQASLQLMSMAVWVPSALVRERCTDAPSRMNVAEAVETPGVVEAATSKGPAATQPAVGSAEA
jgi:hypothetical protein